VAGDPGGSLMTDVPAAQVIAGAQTVAGDVPGTSVSGRRASAAMEANVGCGNSALPPVTGAG
jgi:hypothetical protein